MAGKIKKEEKTRNGYGSSYRKGKTQDLGTKNEIGTVLGGQVWMVKPDEKAKTINPCLCSPDVFKELIKIACGTFIVISTGSFGDTVWLKY